MWNLVLLNPLADVASEGRDDMALEVKSEAVVNFELEVTYLKAISMAADADIPGQPSRIQFSKII